MSNEDFESDFNQSLTSESSILTEYIELKVGAPNAPCAYKKYYEPINQNSLYARIIRGHDKLEELAKNLLFEINQNLENILSFLQVILDVLLIDYSLETRILDMDAQGFRVCFKTIDKMCVNLKNHKNLILIFVDPAPYPRQLHNIFSAFLLLFTKEIPNCKEYKKVLNIIVQFLLEMSNCKQESLKLAAAHIGMKFCVYLSVTMHERAAIATNFETLLAHTYVVLKKLLEMVIINCSITDQEYHEVRLMAASGLKFCFTFGPTIFLTEETLTFLIDIITHSDNMDVVTNAMKTAIQLITPPFVPLLLNLTSLPLLLEIMGKYCEDDTEDIYSLAITFFVNCNKHLRKRRLIKETSLTIFKMMFYDNKRRARLSGNYVCSLVESTMGTPSTIVKALLEYLDVIGEIFDLQYKYEQMAVALHGQSKAFIPQNLIQVLILNRYEFDERRLAEVAELMYQLTRITLKDNRVPIAFRKPKIVTSMAEHSERLFHYYEQTPKILHGILKCFSAVTSDAAYVLDEYKGFYLQSFYKIFALFKAHDIGDDYDLVRDAISKIFANYLANLSTIVPESQTNVQILIEDSIGSFLMLQKNQLPLTEDSNRNRTIICSVYSKLKSLMEHHYKEMLPLLGTDFELIVSDASGENYFDEISCASTIITGIYKNILENEQALSTISNSEQYTFLLRNTLKLLEELVLVIETMPAFTVKSVKMYGMLANRIIDLDKFVQNKPFLMEFPNALFRTELKYPFVQFVYDQLEDDASAVCTAEDKFYLIDTLCYLLKVHLVSCQDASIVFTNMYKYSYLGPPMKELLIWLDENEPDRYVSFIIDILSCQVKFPDLKSPEFFVNLATSLSLDGNCEHFFKIVDEGFAFVQSSTAHRPMFDLIEIYFQQLSRREQLLIKSKYKALMRRSVSALFKG